MTASTLKNDRPWREAGIDSCAHAFDVDGKLANKNPSGSGFAGSVSELKAELEKLPADRREQLERELEKQD